MSLECIPLKQNNENTLLDKAHKGYCCVGCGVMLLCKSKVSGVSESSDRFSAKLGVSGRQAFNC